jgi:XTP/dITP diphosphohydrolase
LEEKMKVLLLASGNPGKLKELRALLKQLEVELTDPKALNLVLHIEETGDTYQQNALIKAEQYARNSGQWTLADDSGLEVDALGGAPGLHSNRYMGPGRSDADRRQRLLQMLQPHPQPWTARFRCCAALVGPDGQRFTAEGTCPGRIIPTERGQNGFGYDPIFLVDSYDKTMAELEMEEKNQISHRARAIHALMPDMLKMVG